MWNSLTWLQRMGFKGNVEEVAGEMGCAPHNANLNLRVSQVFADEVN